LGPLVVRRGAATVEVGGSGLRCLLGLLALQRGQVVARDHIVEVLWQAAPPVAHLNVIQVYVRRLRRLLEPDNEGRSGFRVVVRTGTGYRLDLEDEQLDLSSFDTLVVRARQAVAEGRVEVVERLLGQALACWRGPVLGGAESRLAEHPAAVDVAARRVAAALAYAEAAQALGVQQRAAGLLRPVAADEPLHEALHARLMLALAGTGQQAAALQVYEAVRGRLDQELGIGPGAQLRSAHLRVLRQEISAGRADDGPVGHGLRPREWMNPAQLPAAAAGFTGPAADLARLDALLAGDAPPAVVISAIDGMAGVGKTALAVHWSHRVADRFPDGQLYVNLRGWAAGQPLRAVDVLAGFLRALGVPAEDVPVQVDEAAGMYRSLLAGRRVLAVLDNARDAEQVRPLLPGAAGCLVLVTSRDRLSGLVAREGASRLTLDVLTPDEARALLVRLLGEQRVGAEERAGDELARACAYLPLALRIAAAHLLDQPRRRIGGYLTELTGGDRLTALEFAGDEQAAVRAAFDLSYVRLDADARRLFRLLGLVSGPDIAVPAAAALADTTVDDVRRLLSRLSGAHLLDHHGQRRYAFHDLLRLYAAQRAAAEDSDTDRQAALRRLYDHYLAGATAAADLLYPQILRLPGPATAPGPAPAFTDDAQALAWLETERPNLIAAITHTARHGPHEVAWRLADALRGYLSYTLHTVDWLTAARAAQAAAVAAADLQAQAAVELSLGSYHWFQVGYRQSVDHHARALTLAREAGWTAGQSAASVNLGGLYGMLGELTQATAHLTEGVALARRADDVGGEAVGLSNLGLMWCQRGRLEHAADQVAQALALHHRLGSRTGQAHCLAILGMICHLRGRLNQAEDHLTRALALHREGGERHGEPDSFASLALVHADLGHRHQALDLARTALALVRDSDNRIEEASTLIVSATVHHRFGNHAQALEHYRQALRTARDTGYRHLETEALVGLADTLAALDEPEHALTHARHGLTLARAAPFRLFEGRAYTAQAAIHRRLGDGARAADCARRALAIHTETGHRLGAARTHLLLGHLLHDLGDTDTAVEHWHHALVSFTDIGTPEADQVRALLARQVPPTGD
jgi:tetratricopeptide (TPR) repeat protein